MKHDETLFDQEQLDPQQWLADDLVNGFQDLLEQLIELRLSRKMTQEEVAETIGVSRTAVTAFERYSADPKISSIIRYALAVGAKINLSVENSEAWTVREQAARLSPWLNTTEDTTAQSRWENIAASNIQRRVSHA